MQHGCDDATLYMQIVQISETLNYGNDRSCELMINGYSLKAEAAYITQLK